MLQNPVQAFEVDFNEEDYAPANNPEEEDEF